MDPQTLELLKRRIDKIRLVFFPVVIIIAIAVIMVESMSNNAILYAKYFLVFDGIVSFLFMLEYFYRFSISTHKKRFPFRVHNIFDLLGFAPYFIELVINLFGAAHFYKIFRVFWIFWFLRTLKPFMIVDEFRKVLRNYDEEYEVSLMLIFVWLIISSIVMYYVEGSVNYGVSSVPKALWWSLVTILTVGYGDVYPITNLGKIVGGGMMFVGVVIFSTFSYINILVLIDLAKTHRKRRKIDLKKICTKCFIKNEIDSNYCKICGNILK